METFLVKCETLLSRCTVHRKLECQNWKCIEIREHVGILTRDRGAPSIKQELLNLCIASEFNCYISYSENPIDDGLMGRWESVGDCLWKVPKLVDEKEVNEWLKLGNWLLYLAREPLVETVELDLSGRVPKVKALNNKSVPFAIGSDFDDDPWYCFLRAVVSVRVSP